jgi:three-Cys-motif partner protein
VARNENFFDKQRPAAVYKHGILRRYAPIFASKTGRLSGNQVDFLDGYAGAGEYGVGGPAGSPLLLMEAASRTNFRNIRCILVEQDPETFAKLEETVRRRADPELDVRPMRGSLDERLDEILEMSNGRSLLAFLDPFGPALPYEQILRILQRPGRAPSEVLMHWSLDTMRRCGGLYRAAQAADIAHSEKIARKLDIFLGGVWWRPYFAQSTKEQTHVTALEVAREYSCRIREATGYGSFITEVKNAPQHKAKYLLMQYTKHPDGYWNFADVCSHARTDWFKALHDDEEQRRAIAIAKQQEAEEQLGVQTLFGLLGEPAPDEPIAIEFDREAHEAQYKDEWIETIAGNIEALLREHGELRIIRHLSAVYGTTLTWARITHVRQAVKLLKKRELISDDGSGDFQLRVITLTQRQSVAS